ncbi:tetratricopeptide repeat protein [bacterium]|nr:tetratricopeptide repeat protein [bacterium]
MTKRVSVSAILLALLTLGTAQADDGKMPLSTSSGEARGLYERAQTLMDSMQREKARPLLERAVELDPDFLMAQLLLARTQIRGADVRAIMDHVDERRAEVDLSEAERLYLEGVFAGRNGDRATQQERYEHLAELYPHDERVLTNAGGLYAGIDDDKAIGYFRRASEANPQWASGYNTLGYAYKGVGRNDEAAVAFRRAIEIEPDNPNGYDSYGELLLRMGRFEDAIASYERVLELEPLFPSAHMGIASGLLHLERHEEARARLRRIDDVAPHDGIRAGMCWALAVTWIDEGNPDAALAELEKNLQYSRNLDAPGRVGGDLFTIGRVLLHAGRVDEAEQRFAESIAAARENAAGNERALRFTEVRAEQAALLVATARGNYDAALEHAARYEAMGVELNAPFMTPLVHAMRGQIALARGNPELALEELQQADTTDVMTMYRIARAYERKGDRKSARDWYGYVDAYRGSLNLDYSLVRHEAARRLEAM